jgi:RNA polymerase sigma-70 factor, ECF subfamily
VVLSRQEFEDIFSTYYESLYGYAFSMIRDESYAKEIVSDVFYKLWLKKDSIRIDVSLAGYLYKSIYHGCMDNLKHNKIKKKYKNHVMNQSTGVEDAANLAFKKDFEKNLHDALSRLPEQSRTIFQLSRMEELSYRDIANRLGISTKTVETQMGRALKRLRVALAEFLTVLIFCLWH